MTTNKLRRPTKLTSSIIAPVLAVSALLIAGAGPGIAETGQEVAEELEADAPAVVGTVKDTEVEMSAAEFDGNLAIFEGDEGWGGNPSLVIFLFLDAGESPEGRTFAVRAGERSKGITPHVHYRWRDPESGDLEVDSVSSDYEMKLIFGRIVDGELPGTIQFSVPGESTKVSGEFRATVEP